MQKEETVWGFPSEGLLSIPEGMRSEYPPSPCSPAAWLQVAPSWGLEEAPCCVSLPLCAAQRLALLWSFFAAGPREGWWSNPALEQPFLPISMQSEMLKH